MIQIDVPIRHRKLAPQGLPVHPLSSRYKKWKDEKASFLSEVVSSLSIVWLFLYYLLADVVVEDGGIVMVLMNLIESQHEIPKFLSSKRTLFTSIELC